MITIHQRYRQTDGQTTCDRNTALCTKVHRAVNRGNEKVTVVGNIIITPVCLFVKLDNHGVGSNCISMLISRDGDLQRRRMSDPIRS